LIVYEKSGDVIEIIVRDSTMRRVGTWKFNVADRELGFGILKHIRDKYGFEPEVKPNDSVGEMKKEEKKVDWLDMDPKW
jgi:hypothetical protein